MLDLFRPYVNEGAALIRLSRVLSADEQGRRYIGQGDLVDEFERRFAALVGAPDPDAVISTNSCTSALGIALQLAGVGPGDEVIAPPMTCTATSGAIINRGARIVWADVLPHTGLIDPADVARKVTPRTRAIVAAAITSATRSARSSTSPAATAGCSSRTGATRTAPASCAGMAYHGAPRPISAASRTSPRSAGSTT
jgi:hypothetical protein